MSQFKVEKNVAIPVQFMNGEYKYPFHQMRVKDSFFVPKGQGEPSGSAVYWGRKLKMKFVTHVTREKGKKGVRVWRVK